jgi:hypothetical protein
MREIDVVMPCRLRARSAKVEETVVIRGACERISVHPVVCEAGQYQTGPSNMVICTPSNRSYSL